MPRYMVERTFPNGLSIPPNEEGAKAVMTVVGINAQAGVTWVHSYVSADKKKTYCVYDGPSPDEIQQSGGAQQAADRQDHRSPGAGSLLRM